MVKKNIKIWFRVRIILVLLICQGLEAQAVIDSRLTNESPIFYKKEVKYEFKKRDVMGVPGNGVYSGLMTFAPWSDNSGSEHHQLNFNEGGIYYRNGLPENSNWNYWNQILMADGNGNVGIGKSIPQGPLVISKIPNSNFSHLFFGDPSSTSGQVSSKLTFGGYGIQHAGFAWTPNSSMGEGKLQLAFGGTENPTSNDIMVTFKSNGNVGIGTTVPDSKLTVKGNIHAQEVKVDLNGAVAPDYVFKKDYDLKSLEEVAEYISREGHLPNIPSAEEMEREGMF